MPRLLANLPAELLDRICYWISASTPDELGRLSLCQADNLDRPQQLILANMALMCKSLNSPATRQLYCSPFITSREQLRVFMQVVDVPERSAKNSATAQRHSASTLRAHVMHLQVSAWPRKSGRDAWISGTREDAAAPLSREADDLTQYLILWVLRSCPNLSSYSCEPVLSPMIDSFSFDGFSLATRYSLGPDFTHQPQPYSISASKYRWGLQVEHLTIASAEWSNHTVASNGAQLRQFPVDANSVRNLLSSVSLKTLHLHGNCFLFLL